MAKNSLSVAFFLLLNILFFSMVVSACNSCTPTPSTPTPSTPQKCPRDALKLGVCANVLGNLIKGLTIADPLNTPCCSLLHGLVDLEAAACLCTAIKGNILGIKLNLPISLSLLLNVCDKSVPPRFQC